MRTAFTFAITFVVALFAISVAAGAGTFEAFLALGVAAAVSAAALYRGRRAVAP